MMKQFKVGLIGCGAIAQVHAAVLRSLPGVQLCACCDIVREKAEAMARPDGIAVYEDDLSLLDREKPDAVHLCTPHHLHTPMAEAAATRGIAVFTEKPPAIDREQWARLQQAAQKVPVGVCFQNRYNRNIRMVRDLIENGKFGHVLGARAFVTWSRNAGYYLNSSWRGRIATEGGGALINQAVHTLDLLIWLLGKPLTTEGTIANHHLRGKIEVEDTAEIYLGYEDKTAVLYATTAYAADAPVLIEFQTEKAVLRLERDDLEIITAEGTEHIACPASEPLGKGYWGNGHLPCIRDFYESLEQHKPYQNDVNSVSDTMEALLEIYEQGRKEGTVNL